ncbi:MAG: N-acetylmuramoyl-L-alanine amidase [Geminicoccaceae bacterium]|nr:N-acetylmuramoyl-L-alanine amidase [Geminicoccaceae bacterium]MDW8341171.1 N-acetylmuramoyl-L-alanine amidase [Geminicoccaceae bacterium]
MARLLAIREHPSPNRDARPAGAAIDTIVLHYTGMASAAAALARLCDPAAAVSAHYLVDEAGNVVRLVPEESRAWHAGRSFWAGAERLNDRSIGIELVNPGHAHGLRPFPEAQIAALHDLLAALLARFPIPPARVLGHSDVAPERKLDPGERFPWPRLARAGLAIWPERARARPPDAREADRLLAAIGYRLPVQARERATVLAAFQRRFRPWRVDGRLDAETMGRLEAVAALCAG